MRSLLCLFLSFYALGCGPGTPDDPEPECTAHTQCSDEAKPYCDPVAQACAQLPPGYQIGWGDGEPETVEIELVYQAPDGRVVRGLDFRPESEDLWVTEGQAVRGQRACLKHNGSPEICAPKGADIVVIYRATTTADRVARMRDDNAFHFMRTPSALVFGEGDFFATCPESRTSNFDDEPEDFAGPTLWSAARSVFGVDVGKNGSHMDMLHFTPFCMGLEHERDNIYWAVNGQLGGIDRYDFKADHGPGEEDHSDGEMLRFIPNTLSRIEGVSSQMALDLENDLLYVADTGNRRIIRLDTRSGQRGGTIVPNYDQLSVHHHMNNADFEEIEIDGSILGMPSGLILHDGLLFIVDFSHSEFRVITTGGKELRTLYTDFEPESIGSMVLGPDDRIYFTVPSEGAVYRISHDLR